MGRYTVAYSSFLSRMEEVALLQRMAARFEKDDPVSLRREIGALCRSAIVLLCANVESYIRELGELLLVGIHSRAVARSQLCLQFYYYLSKDVLDDIKNTTDPTRIAQKIFQLMETDGCYWSTEGVFSSPLPVDRFNRGFSTPKFGKISSYFGRFGYDTYQGDLARSMKANYQVAKNTIDHLVDLRNKIAHGDFQTVKTPSDLKDMMANVQRYCKATDAVFATWCRKSLCSIR